MRLFAALFCCLFVIAVGAGSAATGNGLYGKVTRGPIAPMCVAEQPCTEPAAGAVLVFSRNGNDIGRTRVRDDGSFRIALPAATYTVKAVSRRLVEPSSARVVAGRFRHVDFSIDTGIR